MFVNALNYVLGDFIQQLTMRCEHVDKSQIKTKKDTFKDLCIMYFASP